MKYRIRRILNKYFYGIPLKLYKIMQIQLSEIFMGYTINYNPNTDIGKDLYLTGKFEHDEIHLLSKYIKEDSIILDIGANIGLHSIFFSDQANNGLVIAFEPAIETFILLLKNTNMINNIIPLNLAVNDKTKLSKFLIASDNAYSSLKDTSRKNIVSTQNIICVKLDDIIPALELIKIDLIKIDVEGFEKNVILGMQKIIESYKPVIFCEIYKGENSNEDPEGTIEAVVSKGYDAFVIVDGSMTPYIRHDDTYYNYLFIPRAQ